MTSTGSFHAIRRADCHFSPSVVGRWLLKAHIQVLFLKPVFSLRALPSFLVSGVRWTRPGTFLCVVFGKGAHSAFSTCPHGFFSALLLAPMFGVHFCWVDTAGEGCILPRPRLSRHPSPVVIVLSLCWALARQLVWVAWLSFTLLRPLLWQKGWPGQGHFFSPSLLAERKAVLLDQMSYKRGLSWWRSG